MGFIFNDITSASMGIKARLTSWKVCGKLRNFTNTVPGKYGVAISEQTSITVKLRYSAMFIRNTALRHWYLR